MKLRVGERYLLTHLHEAIASCKWVRDGGVVSPGHHGCVSMGLAKWLWALNVAGIPKRYKLEVIKAFEGRAVPVLPVAEYFDVVDAVRFAGGFRSIRRPLTAPAGGWLISWRALPWSMLVCRTLQLARSGDIHQTPLEPTRLSSRIHNCAPAAILGCFNNPGSCHRLVVV